MRGTQHRLDLRDELCCLLRREHALTDELRLVELANARVGVDLLDHQRLRVRRLVLLVVTEAAVADEVDHDVLAEALTVGHREADGRDRSLRVVGVHVDDRHVESLGEIGRVARRAALARVGREADLVVRDQVQRAARRVALEAVQVERLGDDPLAGEGGVAVQQHRQRHGRVVRAVRGRAVGLLGARARPSTTGFTASRWLGFATRRTPTLPFAVVRVPVRCEVVLDVAGAALGVGGDRVDRPLALELAEDVLVGHPDRVREHVQPAAVRHPENDVVRAGVRRQLDRLVEHRDHHVEPFDRELLLARGTACAGTAPSPPPRRGGGRAPSSPSAASGSPIAARLDRLAQPHALLVVGQVLELVGDRAAVRLGERGQDVGERLAGDVRRATPTRGCAPGAPGSVSAPT